LRSALGFLALLLPLAGLGAGYFHLPVADGRPGAVVDALAGEALDALQGRDVVISNGALDNVLQVLAHDRGMPVIPVSLPQGSVNLYRQHLSSFFAQPRQQALLQVGLSAFLQDFLSEPEGLARSASLDMADPLREFGYLVPDRFLYTAVPDEDRVDLEALAESQRPFWQRMEALAALPMDDRNPASSYLRYLLRMASKVINNLGFAMVERGDAEQAEALFHQARRVHPENISALLNLMTIAQAGERPELEAYQAEWDAFKERHMDARVMWSLGALYGYVYNTGFLVRHGMMWAVSGKPRMAEAELRRAAGRDRGVSPSVKAFLARAYLHGGQLEQSEAYYREALGENPGDVHSLLMLAQLALADGDLEEAEQRLADVEQAGVPRERLRFERAVAAYLRGQPDTALAQLKDLTRHEPGHVRAWALLALLTGDGGDPESYEQALSALRNLRGSSPDIRLMLAELHMSRQEWVKARGEIEQVTRMNPRLVRAWEMLVQVDFNERKQELAEDHVRILLTLDPDNYTGNLMLGAFQYGRAQYSLAESSYRAALETRREPVVMNDLAYLIMIKGGDLAEARTLIEEAIALNPRYPLFLSTRGELNLMEGRLDEAERDLQQALASHPDYAPNRLLAARLYAARNQKDAALELAESLLERQGELPPEQQERLQDLLRRLR
jgi:tetratricopeptide (TPR) repeat protein